MTPTQIPLPGRKRSGIGGKFRENYHVAEGRRRRKAAERGAASKSRRRKAGRL